MIRGRLERRRENAVGKRRMFLVGLTLGGISGGLIANIVMGNGNSESRETSCRTISKLNTVHSKADEANFDELKQVLRTVRNSLQEFTEEKKMEAAMILSKKKKVGVPISVRVNQANLRAKPRVDSKKIAVIERNTVLLAKGMSDGWVNVVSPFGNDSWVKAELVQVLKQKEG